MSDEWERRWDTRPDATMTVFGNDQPCRKCGAPAGKQCIMADSTFRDYPHQKRRDDATRLQEFADRAKLESEGTNEQ